MRKQSLESRVAVEAAKRDIAARIRRVCQDFGEAEFEALVQRMAEIDVRYRLRDEWLAFQPLRRPSVN